MWVVNKTFYFVFSGLGSLNPADFTCTKKSFILIKEIASGLAEPKVIKQRCKTLKVYVFHIYSTLRNELHRKKHFKVVANARGANFWELQQN